MGSRTLQDLLDSGSEQSSIELNDRIQPGLEARRARKGIERYLSPNRALLYPPRGLRVENGALAWDAPTDPTGITHYNVYVDSQSVISTQVPAGQTRAQGVSGTDYFVASYNSFSGARSAMQHLRSSGGLGGAVALLSLVTLTADTVITTSTSMAQGQLLIVVITQDAVGNHFFSWGTGFRTNTPATMNTLSNSIARFLFAFIGTEYVLVCDPYQERF